MDGLTYDYGNLSNKLLNVTDGGDKTKGFIEPASTAGNDYSYDANGSMLTDQNKGLSGSITYNFLNLPELVTRGTNTVRYIYDASGRKLAQTANFSGYIVKQTDYAGEYNYENDFLQFVGHEEGRIMMANSALIYSNSGEATTDYTTVITGLTTVTQNGNEKYVQVTASSGGSLRGAFPIGGTFNVVAGEKYRIRVKGYSTGANTASIQVKASGTNVDWPGASIPNSVNAESWVEQIVTIPTGATTLQTGVMWATAANGEVMYINEVEITKISTTTAEYQYHLKDHLGNVRMTFTSLIAKDSTSATYETANQTTEQSQYLRYTTAKRVNASIFDHTNGAAAGYSERLNGSANEKYGLARSLSVMPGDVINTEVFAKYADPVSSNWTGAFNTLMAQIASNTAGVVYDGASYSSSTSSFPFTNPQSHTPSSGAPKAYLTWLIFDRNFVFVDGGYQPITTAAKEAGTDVPHEKISSGNIVIKQPGYIYVYLSNEETAPVEVYFDDFKVTQTKSPVIQTDDYYPFGLTFNSYQRENGFVNNHQYNGKEKQDELDLGWLDYGARMFLSQIGRWAVVDPKGDKYNQYSPYNYVLNNPLIFKDPDGKEIYFVTSSGAVLAATKENLKNTEIASAHKGVTSTESGKATWDKYSKNDEKDIYIGLSEAAISSTAINGLSGSDLDKNGDGVVDKNISNGYEVFVGINISKSKGKKIALISLKKSDFGHDPDAIDEREKVGQSETLFHEVKAHVDIDDKEKQHGNGDKNHASYGSKASVLNMGAGTIKHSSPAGKFLQQVLDSKAFRLKKSTRKDLLDILSKTK